jgi:tRNA dimethylallyltransferase
MNTPPLRSFDLLAVCGPTASGKTALAVALARELDGEIISADSRQVYRGLDIGSGKDLHEYVDGGRAVPYHCIDIADPADIYTLFHFQRDFYRAFGEIRSRDRLPLLCGGTGLYIEAVLRGYEIPPVPEDRELRQRLMRLEKPDLERMLAELDADLYSRTDRSSVKRIVRAIEIGRHRASAPPPVPADPALRPLVLCTRWERADLHRRIDRRLDERLSAGMVDEVRHLRDRGLPDGRLLMLGMEYKYLTRHLRGEIEYAAMVEGLRHAIYQLAKRQETYFRGMERRGCAVQWIDRAEVEAARSAVGASGIMPVPSSIAPQ